jgi:hypothetical protein
MNSRYSILFKIAVFSVLSAFILTNTNYLIGAEKDTDKSKNQKIVKEYKVDLNKLPKSADKKVEFKKDIQPILKKSCLECHEEGSVFGEFRLDSREGALKGGEHGIDIVVGKSEKSPLIYFVTHLVPDLEMPPKGEGEPLTKEQISLLRAWIDQGLKWE